MDYETIDEYRSSVKERLARIESILQRELPDIKEQLKISNGRTRSLENWRNYILGGMAILIFLFTNLKYESIMNIKSMLVKLAEEQAEKMQQDGINHLGSDEMAKNIASAINKRIDIPFVSEEKEQIFFEKIVDVVTDILEGVFKGK